MLPSEACVGQISLTPLDNWVNETKGKYFRYINPWNLSEVKPLLDSYFFQFVNCLDNGSSLLQHPNLPYVKSLCNKKKQKLKIILLQSTECHGFAQIISVANLT